jgi:biotin carboxyl carrier protein
MEADIDLSSAESTRLYFKAGRDGAGEPTAIAADSESKNPGHGVRAACAVGSPVQSEIRRMQSQLTRMAALSELVARIESADNAAAACQIVAEQLQSFLPVDQVLIGLCNENNAECKLTAVSDVASFHPHGDFAVAAQGALQECLVRNEPVCWPPREEHRSGGLLAHRQFAAAVKTDAVMTAPLRDAGGSLRGAWMVTSENEIDPKEDVSSFLGAAQVPVASALGMLARAEKGRLARTLAELKRLGREKRGRWVLLAVSLLALVLCLPVHYQAKCDCTVEPVLRRYVAAPWTGPLEKSLVQPGDVVDQGQLLARMDGRELRMELAAANADLHRATKQHTGHLATLQSGEAEVARYEADRLRARSELLEHRQHNVEIRSPIAGVVVSGDHEDAEGMPLEVGQPLFEVAPLDEMVVELGLAEDDFAYIRSGMPVTIRLDAFPLRRFQATIETIHPRAELRDDENVFIAEVRLQRPGTALRPGMRGTARVQADRYPLGWNLFRRPLAAVVAWLGW